MLKFEVLMIRLANNKDLKSIKSLWDVSFPNEEKFTKFYFDNIFCINKTLVYEINGEIVSMLQMLEYNSGFDKIMYIYGVCTYEKFRKQGIMSKLMNECFDIAKSKEYVSVIIVPAEEYLFDIYEKFGFVSNLNVRLLKHKTIEFEHNVIQQEMTVSDFESINLLYEKSVKNCFHLNRDKQFFENQLKLYSKNAIKYIENDVIVGYSFGYTTDNVVYLDEIIANDIEKCLNSYKNIVTYKTFGGNTKFAMIKSLTSNIEPVGYINLMYN